MGTLACENETAWNAWLERRWNVGRHGGRRMTGWNTARVGRDGGHGG